jgi:LPS-assembly lipoprotein
MWWCKHPAAGHLARLAIVFVAAGLTAGCFEPLYGNRPEVGTDNVHDKLAAVELAPASKPPSSSGAASPSGNVANRLSVAMHNALQYDLNGGTGATAPTHRLLVAVGGTGASFMIDITTGLPTSQIAGVVVDYQLVEIATNKVVLKDTASSDVDYDTAGSEQRFAVQRAELDAEDRAVKIVAEAIRNRLASYFVAGT